jgi:hypothetical protein
MLPQGLPHSLQMLVDFSKVPASELDLATTWTPDPVLARGLQYPRAEIGATLGTLANSDRTGIGHIEIDSRLAVNRYDLGFIRRRPALSGVGGFAPGSGSTKSSASLAPSVLATRPKMTTPTLTAPRSTCPR